jgi:hypothetical protein
MQTRHARGMGIPYQFGLTEPIKDLHSQEHNPNDWQSIKCLIIKIQTLFLQSVKKNKNRKTFKILGFQALKPKNFSPNDFMRISAFGLS